MHFIFFLIIFLSIYSLMHLVVYIGVRPLLYTHTVRVMVGIWMVFMISGPFFVRIIENQGYEISARFLAWTTYSWMGFLFFNFSLFWLIGLISIGFFLIRRCLSAFPHFTLLSPKISAVILCLSFTAVVYGCFEAQDLRLERITITTDKMQNNKTVRIVQLSDLHLGLMNRSKQLQPVVEKLNELSPDVLVVTGDMVDAQINHLNGLVDLWKQLTPPMGKYAVTGNHELYAGLKQSIEFHEASGFKVLRNEHVILNNHIRLAGVDDEQITGTSIKELILYAEQRPDLFTILLKHRPVIGKQAQGYCDLQLSGHAHRGQIFPFNFVTGLVFPMQSGLFELAAGCKLYVSRGTGTWGPPMRLFSPPEITLIEIIGIAET